VRGGAEQALVKSFKEKGHWEGPGGGRRLGPLQQPKGKTLKIDGGNWSDVGQQFGRVELGEKYS